jgi:hypothetical protein
LVKSLNNSLDGLKISDEILMEGFKEKWPKFIRHFEKEISKVVFQSASNVFSNILSSFKKSGLPNQEIGQLVHFNEGFESHAFYEVVLKCAKSRLYFFGRKNRKVFDKEYAWFFEGLRDKINHGFDFKCLFLDPDSDDSILNSAHKDLNFKEQLTTCIYNTKGLLNQHHLHSNGILKKYNFQRPYSIAIVDDVVLYTPIEYSVDGKAEKLTRVSFSMTSINTNQGKVMEHNFENAWQNSLDIN